MLHRLSFLTLALLLTATVRADDEKHEPLKPAPSKITNVTVYSSTALVTREVTAPEGAGLTEVIVSPMPPYTMQSSLYAEGNDNIRVLSVRFRTRAIAEDTREEVRKLDSQIKSLTTKQQTLDSELKAIGENLKLLDKLEGFTAKSLEHLTDKGQLDSEKIILLAKFVQDDRTQANQGATLRQAAVRSTCRSRLHLPSVCSTRRRAAWCGRNEMPSSSSTKNRERGRSGSTTW